MSESLKHEILIIGGWNYFALIILCIGMFILMTRANKNRSFKVFSIVQVAMVIWLVGKIFKTVSPTVELRWFFIVVYYFGICLLEVSFLDFAYVYNKGVYLKKKFRVALYLIGALQILLVATNPLHHLFYARFNFRGDDFGSLFYVHVSINYLAIIIGIVLCTQKFTKQVVFHSKIKKYLITFAILMPLVLNYLYIFQYLKKIFRYFGWQIFDITPIVYTASLLAFVYATFKFEFFDVSPIMKHEIAESLNTGICLTDIGGQILYSNPSFKTMFDLEIQDNIEPLMQNKNNLFKYKDLFIRFEKEKIIHMGSTYWIYVFNNMSYYYELIDQIEEKKERIFESNQKLKRQIQVLIETSEKAASNFVARELHDIMGHSLVASMKLLESAKIIKVEDHRKYLIEQSKVTLLQGLREMEVLTVEQEHPSTIQFAKDIRQLILPLQETGVEVKFFDHSKLSYLQHQIYSTVLKIIKELITNILKHSHCTRVMIRLNIDHGSLSMHMMDNGRGVEMLKLGNGLVGIQERIESIKGNVEFSSESGEGFQTTIQCPLL
ncbi:MAG: hypothetical protein JXR88_02405 [Clostridia bacterium]|nr:hypothetical protein [Clostridia bacterium]